MATHSNVLPGESQGWGNLLGCRLMGRTESDTTEATAAAAAAVLEGREFEGKWLLPEKAGG